MSSYKPTAASAPLLFGEVLFDCFPGEEPVLGGAAFNVCWHLQGFGLSPLLLSRIGEDDAGRRVVAAMEEWGLDTSLLQVDPASATGRVEIALTTDGHTFSIPPGQAWDRIQLPLAAELPPLSLIYHGSLALREEVSRRTLQALTANHLPRFVDINLRDPWWQRDGLLSSMAGAETIKLNDEELLRLAAESGQTCGSLNEAADWLFDQSGCQRLLVTGGSSTSLLLERINGKIESIERKVEPVDGLVDTVGAGDAFASVAILAAVQGWPVSAILPRAQQFAALVCLQRGALIRDRAIYERLLVEWGGSREQC